MIPRVRSLGVVLLAILMAAPQPALACPVCFGASDEPMAVATNMGIIAMLVVVAGVLGAFASFFIYLMRRAKLAAEPSEPADAASQLDDRGTAQC
jgi:hypothetical protein